MCYCMTCVLQICFIIATTTTSTRPAVDVVGRVSSGAEGIAVRQTDPVVPSGWAD